MRRRPSDAERLLRMEKQSGNGLIRHILFVIAALFVTLGLPAMRSEAFQLATGGTDAVSSATTILEAPSGEYVILINTQRHEASGTLQTWQDFFAGKDIGIVFEDLNCIVIRGDTAGEEAARSYQSRLPENQMKIRLEDSTLMLSKAQHGRFDVILMSREMYEASGASSEKKAERIDLVEADGL